MRLPALLLSLLFSVPGLASDPTPAPTLTVYTYDSFTAEWGPGPAVKKAFEARCACTLNLVALEGGVGILHRLKLEGESTQADLVLGLDMNLISEARATGLFAPHQSHTEHLRLPIPWKDDTFVPYDWSHFAFVYDTQALANPPTSLQALIDAPDDLKIIIQDPRTSTPGQGLLLWMRHVYGDQAPQAWERLNRKVLSVTKGWSDAYFSLFMNGEAPIVLSYSTSPGYHMAVDKTERYQAMAFAEGHYLQVEVAGRLRTSRQPALAQQFLDFMLTADFQRHIPLGNVMHPVIDLGEELPAAFQRLIQPGHSRHFTPDEVATHRQAWIREWLDASSR